jgi:hypothetical protein
MKQSVHNSLRQALAQAPPAGPHPDLGVLAAFSEGGLLTRERQLVLAHLASCADCRELLSVAADEAPAPYTEANPFVLQRASRSPLREWLPWIGIAAGILIVCSAGVLYRQGGEQKSYAGAATSTAGTVDDPTAPNQMAQNNDVIKDHDTSHPSAGAQSASAFAPAGSSAQVSPEIRGAHWRIGADGHAERSFGDNRWKTVLPGEPSKVRVIFVFDNNVWIGGENSRLYHSADGGATWRPVSLPDKNGAGHSIAHVRFTTSQAGAVLASDGTSWTTTDGGAIWR